MLDTGTVANRAEWTLKQIVLAISVLGLVITLQMFRVERPFVGHYASYQGTVMASIARNMVREELECNEAIERAVLGLIDHAHSTLAQLLDDRVMRYSGTDHCCSVSVSFVVERHGIILQSRAGEYSRTYTAA